MRSPKARHQALRTWLSAFLCAGALFSIGCQDKEGMDALTKGAKEGLTAKGFTVAGFASASGANGAVAASCSGVQKGADKVELCLWQYADGPAAVHASGAKLKGSVPEGSGSFARGKTLFVVKAATPPNPSVTQEVLDVVTTIP